MKVEEYGYWVGAIVTNLSALETALRYFLATANDQPRDFPKRGDIDAPINFLTDYRSLNNLLMLYNEKLTAAEIQKHAIAFEPILVIRDSLAHGRILTTAELPFTLWKFGEPINGRVPIEFSEVMTLDWLKKTAKLVEDEKDKVIACFKDRGYKGLR